MISENLKERFCKDYSIPINLFSEPYFEERIKLMGYEDKYNDFVDMIQTKFNGNEQEYFEYYNKLKDTIINYIKDSEVYNDMQTAPIKDIQPIRKSIINLGQSNVYKMNNVGEYFISIDMSKANFTSLVLYGLEHNLNFYPTNNYKHFMREFTSIDYFAESKYIRQVIFGNCNPKRQVSYENKIMWDLLNHLIDTKIVNPENMYSICSDEIIIKVADEQTGLKLHNIIDNELQSFPFGGIYKNELFQLGKFEGTEAYIKKYLAGTDKEYDLKCVNAVEAPFVYRCLQNKPYEMTDMVTKMNNRKVRLLEIPSIYLTYDKNINNNKEQINDDIELT